MKFNDFFKNIPILETDRLILRQFEYEDMKSYLPIIRNIDVQCYLGGGISDLKDDRAVSNWLKNINDRLLKSKTVFTWCIDYKNENKVIGRIDLGGFIQKSAAEISYYISKDYWNRGFATEAVAEVLRFGVNDLKLHRIQAMVMPENLGSIKVLENNGFEKEGLLKKCYFGKEFHDAYIMSVVNEKNLYSKLSSKAI